MNLKIWRKFIKNKLTFFIGILYNWTNGGLFLTTQYTNKDFTDDKHDNNKFSPAFIEQKHVFLRIVFERFKQ